MAFYNLSREVILSHGLETLSQEELVGEFSKNDRLLYLDTYTQAIQVLDMDDWKALRVKLCTGDVKEVMELLDQYVHAYKAKKQADYELNDYIDNRGPMLSDVHYTRELQDHWDEMDRLRDVCDQAFSLSDELYAELSKLLEKA